LTTIFEPMPRPGQSEHVLAVDVAARAHAEFALDAALRSSHASGWVASTPRSGKKCTSAVGHFRIRSQRLQLAIAALSRSPGRQWFALTNSICDQRAPHRLEFGVSISTSWPACALVVQAAAARPLTTTVHSLQLPCAPSRVAAEMRDIDAGVARPLRGSSGRPERVGSRRQVGRCARSRKVCGVGPLMLYVSRCGPGGRRGRWRPSGGRERGLRVDAGAKSRDCRRFRRRGGIFSRRR